MSNGSGGQCVARPEDAWGLAMSENNEQWSGGQCVARPQDAWGLAMSENNE